MFKLTNKKIITILCPNIALIMTYAQTNIHAHLIESETDRETDRHGGNLIARDRKNNRQIDRQTVRQTDIYIPA